MQFSLLDRWRNAAWNRECGAGLIYGAVYWGDYVILAVGHGTCAGWMPVLAPADTYNGIVLGDTVFTIDYDNGLFYSHKGRTEFDSDHSPINHNRMFSKLSDDVISKRVFEYQTTLDNWFGTKGAVWTSSSSPEGIAEQYAQLRQREEHLKDSHHSDVHRNEIGLGPDSLWGVPALPTPDMVVKNVTFGAQAVLNGFKDLEANLDRMLEDKPIQRPTLREEFRNHHLIVYLKETLHPSVTITVLP